MTETNNEKSEKDSKEKTINAKNIVENVDPEKLVEDVGSLYTSLGKEHTDILADHLEHMQDIQKEVGDLATASKLLKQEYEEIEATNKRLNDTNTKLMFQQLNNAKDKVTDDHEDESAKLDNALKNIVVQED